MKVSVIIPTYNRANLVCEAINSVLKQTFQDFEIIVVDDGSTDNTAQDLTVFGDKIRYIKQSNNGVNHARNTALSVSKGEYIATLDNDDLWLPYKLAVQVKILDHFPELAYTFSNFSIYKDKNNIKTNGIQSWFHTNKNWNEFYDHSISLSEITNEFNSIISNDEKLYFGDIYLPSLQHYYVLPSSTLFRKSMIPQQVKFVEHDPICGDWDFFARLSRDNPVSYLDHDTTYNRSHEDAVRLTRTQWEKQLEFRIDMLERLYFLDEDFYLKNSEQLKKAYMYELELLSHQQLLKGERKSAKKTLNKYRDHFPQSNPGIFYFVLSSLCFIPKIEHILQLYRKLRG